MKKVTAILICVLVVLTVAWGLWSQHHRFRGNDASTPVVPESPSPHSFVSSFVKPTEWQEFQSDRDTTLKTDPDVALAYKALLDEMGAQQQALDAAMLKADPSVAPALAKLELVRKHVPAPDSTPAAPKIYMLTPAEGQEIQTARLAALKANPDLDRQKKGTGTRTLHG